MTERWSGLSSRSPLAWTPAIRRDSIGGPRVAAERPALSAHAYPRRGRERARPPGAVAPRRPVRVAARSGLARASVWSALGTLEEIGIVRREGTGKARLYRINDRHLLAAALNALFEAEAARYAGIRGAVSAAVSTVRPPVLAAWIYGSVARGEDRIGSDLDVAVVAPAADLEPAEHAIREALAVSGGELGLVPSVVGLDPEDVTRLSRENDPWWVGVVADALMVLGPRPEEFVRLHAQAATARLAT